MVSKKSLLAVAAAAAFIAAPAHAAVALFDSVGDSSTILYATTHDGATLSVSVVFSLLSISSTSATFSTTVSNNSTGPGTNRLVSFGIDVVSPTLSGATTTGGVWDAALNATLPSFQSVDLCLFSANGCPGGAINQGLGEGGVNSFNLILATVAPNSFTPGGISFTSPYGVKFQDVGNSGQSFEFAGCIVGDPNCGSGGSTNVPEPGTLVLFGLGLLALTAARRRWKS